MPTTTNVRQKVIKTLTQRQLALAQEAARKHRGEADKIAAEQDQRAAAEQARIDAERREQERAAAEVRKRREAEQRERQEAERAAAKAEAEVKRLEQAAIREAAEAAASNLRERAIDAHAERPDDADVAAQGELWSAQVLGTPIPAALWHETGWDRTVDADFMGARWTFTHTVEGFPVLVLNSRLTNEPHPQSGNLPDMEATEINTLADLGKLLVERPHALTLPDAEEEGESV